MANIKKFRTILNKHQHVAIDSSVFIYQFEQHPQFEPLCSVIFEKVSHNAIELSAAAIIVAEVLAQPFQKKNIEVISRYQEVFLNLPNFRLINIDYDISLIAAQIRAEYTIFLPDALHIAAAIHSGASAFITNDTKLKRVKDIRVICLKDFV